MCNNKIQNESTVSVITKTLQDDYPIVYITADVMGGSVLSTTLSNFFKQNNSILPKKPQSLRYTLLPKWGVTIRHQATNIAYPRILWYSCYRIQTAYFSNRHRKCHQNPPFYWACRALDYKHFEIDLIIPECAIGP